MDIQNEKLKRLLIQAGVKEKKAQQVVDGTHSAPMYRDNLQALLRAAGTPLMPNVIKDPMSPRVDDHVGEHNRVYCYIPGNFDIGHIEIKGFTLISNNELAALKQMALGNAHRTTKT